MENKRTAGILMPISSLPSNYGIGTLGKEAYKFVDFLVKAKQTYWQILPLGPTSYGDSPYQSFSSHAGNPYFIDLDMLVEDGLLSEKDLRGLNKSNKNYIDYGFLYETRFKVLYKAYKNGFKKDINEFRGFIDNNPFICEYAFYMAIKEYFGMVSWIDWPDEDIRKRKPEVVEKYKKLLEDKILFYEYIQFLFFKQFNNLKKYMNDLGIKLIGDVPFYIPLDSCDCWMNPECFELDDNYVPKAVAGVPPDYFSADGQLWGNPLYNFEYMKSNGYKWWIDRIGSASKLYDVIRIDHFRGFESYWSVPFKDTTAKNGHWVQGPNMDLLNVLKGWFSNVDFIAEDLGYHTPGVQYMLNEFGFPGMKILEFGFDSREKSNHAPHCYVENSVCYVGTHDNSTVVGWLTAANKQDVKYALKYLGLKDATDFNWAMIRTGMSSVSRTFIAQMQDYLGLDDRARINVPGTLGDNWKWRIAKGKLTNKLANKIKEYTQMYERC
ncbi:MAG: 4-alpha-glucanotransferase [Erysipelotrichaceae bacterium]|nr:4-alpha-glucanotransferase [Erysipelotrichaceae bacterium]